MAQPQFQPLAMVPRDTGIHQKDLKPCALCGRGVMHGGSPVFYRLRVEAFCVDLGVMGHQVALAQSFGGGVQGDVLAHFVFPSQAIARPLDATFEALLCQDCSLGSCVIPRLLEQDAEQSAAVDAQERAERPA